MEVSSMAYNGPDRRSKDTERRKNGAGKPPPGTVIDRRLGLDPRKENDPRAGEDTAKGKSGKESGASAHTGSSPAGATPTEKGHTGLERKRGRGRRLSEFTKSAEEGEMTTEQFLFLMAIDAFKKGNDRMFPTWTDVLEVIRLLGYRKTMPTELNLPSAEDWLERSDSPANVRPERWAERFTETGSKAGGSESPKKVGPKSEEELTDEALEAFEAAFGDEPEEFLGDEFDAELGDEFDDGLSEAA
jgi:hypothetical protein